VGRRSGSTDPDPILQTHCFDNEPDGSGSGPGARVDVHVRCFFVDNNQPTYLTRERGAQPINNPRDRPNPVRDDKMTTTIVNRQKPRIDDHIDRDDNRPQALVRPYTVKTPTGV